MPVWLMTRCAQRENSAAASGHTTLPCGMEVREMVSRVSRGDRGRDRGGALLKYKIAVPNRREPR